MASFNKVILVGNLTRDPQVRYTPSGMAVADVGLAVNHTWFDKQSNQKTSPKFSKRAANISNLAAILVHNRLQLTKGVRKKIL